MPKISQPTPITWEQHKVNWKNCTNCPLHNWRHSIVLLRGSIPADVLFIGEAPGTSDDVLGKPFSGPIGKYLDQIAEEASEATRQWIGRETANFTFAYTHLTACVPKDNFKWRNPTQEELEACYERFKEVLRLTQPFAVIELGKVVSKFLKNKNLPELSSSYKNYPARSLLHAASIHDPLTIANSALEVRGILHQNAVVVVRDVLIDITKRM